jgi:hypothetical protein
MNLKDLSAKNKNFQEQRKESKIFKFVQKINFASVKNLIKKSTKKKTRRF